MKLLYSNILPLGTDEGQKTITETFNEYFHQADRVEIAVGYVSRASLEELDTLVEHNQTQRINLIIGMYYIEGMPEGSYHTAVKINKRWNDAGIGEIRMVRSLKYHGKLYVFYKENKPLAAFIGSANLGVIKLEASNRRQYEISSMTTDEAECNEIMEFIERLKGPNISANIAEISGMPLIYETNTSLTGIELVTQVPQSNVDFYRRCAAYASFLLPLKVPAYDERHMDDGKHYTKSNINVCYFQFPVMIKTLLVTCSMKESHILTFYWISITEGRVTAM